MHACSVVFNSFWPQGHSPPGFTVYGISQARILEWIAVSFPRGSFRPRDWTHVSWFCRRIFFATVPPNTLLKSQAAFFPELDLKVESQMFATTIFQDYDVAPSQMFVFIWIHCLILMKLLESPLQLMSPTIRCKWLGLCSGQCCWAHQLPGRKAVKRDKFCFMVLNITSRSFAFYFPFLFLLNHTFK